MPSTVLNSLPVELLYEIHLYALNPHLGAVSFHMRDVLLGMSSFMRATWLVCYCEHELRGRPEVSFLFQPPSSPHQQFPYILEECIKYRICSLSVLQGVHRIWEPRLNYRNDAGEIQISDPLRILRLPLPRRLFRGICICHESPEDIISPCALHNAPSKASSSRLYFPKRGHPPTVQDTLAYFKYLDSSFAGFVCRPIFGASSGIPLTLSVASASIRIVKHVLSCGADPAAKDGIAVKAAIRMKSLKMVKLLIECEPDPVTEQIMRVDGDELETQSLKVTSGRHRRVMDRMEVTKSLVSEAMRVDARDIVDYFLNDKGHTPNIRMLGQTFFSHGNATLTERAR